MELLNNFVVQTAVMPLVLSLGIAFVLRNTRFAGLGLLIGFLAAYLAILGVPNFPPAGSTQKLGWVIFAVSLLAVILDIVKAGSWRIYPVWVFTAIGVGWMAWPRLKSFDLTWVVAYGVIIVLVAITLMRTHKLRSESLLPESTVLALSIGVGVVSLIGSSASIAQLSFAMAAANGGLLLLNWPVKRFLTETAAMAGVSIIAFFATILIFYTQAMTWPMLVLGLVPFIGRLGEEVAVRRRLPKYMGGAMAVIGCFLPVLITLGFTYLLTPVSESLY